MIIRQSSPTGVRLTETVRRSLRLFPATDIQVCLTSAGVLGMAKVCWLGMECMQLFAQPSLHLPSGTTSSCGAVSSISRSLCDLREPNRWLWHTAFLTQRCGFLAIRYHGSHDITVGRGA